MIDLIKNLPLARKFLLSGLVALAATCVPLSFYLRAAQGYLDVAIDEQSGIAPTRQLLKTMQAVQLHRMYAELALDGDGIDTMSLMMRRTRDEAGVSADSDFAKLKTVFSDEPADSALRIRLNAIDTSWTELHAAIVAKKLSREQSYGAHTGLIKQLLDAINAEADNSSLSYDPAADGYHLMSAIVLQLPDTIEGLAVTRHVGTLALARRTTNAAERAALGLGIGRARDGVTRMARELDKTFALLPELSNNYKQAYETAVKQTYQICDIAEKQILANDTPDYPPAKFRAEFESILKAQDDLINTAFNSLEQLLQSRIKNQNRERVILAGLIALLGIASVVLGYLVARSVVIPVKQAAHIVDSIAAGNFNNTINDYGTNEVGHMLTALGQMQTDLRQRLEQEQLVANANLRIRNALDNVAGNVMIADNDRQIIYLNHAIKKLFSEAEADIRRALPNFTASNVLGSSIDSFHKYPNYQIEMLGALTSTHRSPIDVGGRTFALSVNVIRDASGERVGTVVEWLDRTEEVAVEREIEDVVSNAAVGEYSKRIETLGKQGFFLDLSNHINKLLHTSEDGLNEIIRVFGALAQGNLTETIDYSYAGAFDQLKQDANTTIETLTKIVSNIKHSADAINQASHEIAADNNDLASRTEEQSAHLAQTTLALVKFTDSIRKNADNAERANQLAIGAGEIAEKGGAVVSEVVTTMSQINEASKKIVDIISVIDSIAFQTNILALNAAVEAARAGEQGRGFAVVAAEVRSLAQRSASAAKEIKELISNSVDRVQTGSRLVDQAGKTMTEVVSSVQRVTDIMAEISTASREQRSGIDQVSHTIGRVDEATQQNAAMVDKAATASRDLENQAANLMEAISIFQISEDSSVTQSIAPVAKSVATRAALTATAKPTKARKSATKQAKQIAAENPDALSNQPTDKKPKSDWNEF